MGISGTERRIKKMTTYWLYGSLLLSYWQLVSIKPYESKIPRKIEGWLWGWVVGLESRLHP